MKTHTAPKKNVGRQLKLFKEKRPSKKSRMLAELLDNSCGTPPMK